MIDKYAQAGFDEVYVANTGPHWQGLFDLYAEHVLPKISDVLTVCRTPRPGTMGAR